MSIWFGAFALAAIAAASALPLTGKPAQTGPSRITSRAHIELASLNFDQYVRLSSAIVRGRVLDTAPTVDPGGVVTTMVRLAVLGSFKSKTPRTIDVAVIGGSTEKHETICSLSPELFPGEEIVAFLHEDPASGIYGLLGLQNGVGLIRGRSTGTSEVHGGPGPGGAIPLVEYEALIRDRVTALEMEESK